MNKKIFTINNILLLSIIIILFLCNVGYCVDGGSGDPKGAHNQTLPGLKDILCTRCHFSKKGKELSIWETLPSGAETVANTEGMRTICQSCHYPGNAVNALSGFTFGNHPLGGHHYTNGNIFINQSISRSGETHVMHDWASIEAGTKKLPEKLDRAFVLKKKDKWGLPKLQGDTTNSGVYCGTCHDQHKQPDKIIDGNGDYLRKREEGSVGLSNERTAFCIQCHNAISKDNKYKQHGIDIGCLTCHHPHDGATLIEENSIVGQWILLSPLNKINFRALPNVISFKEQKDGIDVDISSTCYSCHSPQRDFKQLDIMKVPIINGDDSDVPCEHHPMGNQANAEQSPRATDIEYLSSDGQLTCISCHQGFHEGDELYYLREDFEEDDSTFCLSCHQNKSVEDLAFRQGIAHWRDNKNSPNKRGNCMFCHFIHDGPDRGNTVTPSVSALIRVNPKNLAWSKQTEDKDTDDFEDICFGCHSNTKYMGDSKQIGSALLKPNQYKSHPFSGSLGQVSKSNIGNEFFISDGTEEKILNDYGVLDGQIYCSTCHNVHNYTNQPYLRGDYSAFEANGFCERCHTENPTDGKSSHPVGVKLNEEKTISEFPNILYGRSKGSAKGRTSDNTAEGKIICLTCHSVHTAVTDYRGQITTDPKNKKPDIKNHGSLLVMDNFSSASGSDLCRLCHEPYRGVVYSKHDFSDELASGKTGGICFACHTPHNTGDKKFLWCRSLKEEREAFSQINRPAYTLESTIYCYDCHDDDKGFVDNDPPKNEFMVNPQDIAFVDGPGSSGQVGFYETMPPGDRFNFGVSHPAPRDGSNTGGHFIKTPNINKTHNGIETGDKLPCNLCHDPHKKNNNEVFLKNPLGVNTEDNLRASHNTRNGTGTGREICASCHGYLSKLNLKDNENPYEDPSTGVETLPIRIYNTDIMYPIEENPNHLKSDPTPCTDCHKHSRMSTRLATGNHTRNFHFFGSSGPGLVELPPLNGCTLCHPMFLSYNSVGDLLFNDDQPLSNTNVCHPCHSAGGEYDGLKMAKTNWKNEISPYDPPFINEPNVPNGRDLLPDQEKWCASCHDDEPSVVTIEYKGQYTAPNIAGAKSWGNGFYETGHGLSNNRYYMDSNRTGAELKCTDCHNTTEDHIANIRYSTDTPEPIKTYQKARRLKSINNRRPLVIPRTVEEYVSTDFNLCFSCHDEKSLIGLGEEIIEKDGNPVRYFNYSASNNHNPYPKVDKVETLFRNIDYKGGNRHDPLTGDFKKPRHMNEFVPVNSHWNHLAYAYREVVVEPVFEDEDRPERIQYCSSGKGCHNKIVWDSDHDPKGDADSRMSCVTCHNPHGTSYTAMTKNDLSITHEYSDSGTGTNWEYGYIGSGKYGLCEPENEDDVYCNECHARYQRYGKEGYKYYPYLSIDQRDFINPMPPQ